MDIGVAEIVGDPQGIEPGRQRLEQRHPLAHLLETRIERAEETDIDPILARVAQIGQRLAVEVV